MDTINRLVEKEAKVLSNRNLLSWLLETGRTGKHKNLAKELIDNFPPSSKLIERFAVGEEIEHLLKKIKNEE